MKLAGAGLLLIAGLVFGQVQAFALSNITPGTTGVDVSWPNCSAKLPANPSFGLVGVNGGLNFHPNACVGQEASWFKNGLSLYLNTGYPGLPYSSKYSQWPKHCSLLDNVCLAYNYGYNAGKYAYGYSLSRGVVSRDWYLDVEIANSWTNNIFVNRSSIEGEADAINFNAKPLVLGVYAYQLGWQTITGNWQNKWPAWIASNSNYRSVALNYCHQTAFNGGDVLLTQYITRLDDDYAC